jgi:methyl-accepting chemotaxis protein
MTNLVKTSSEEMRQKSGEVANETKNLDNLTEQVSGGMGEMATGAEQINAAVSRVSELSASNKENIDDLVIEVSKFKVE